MLYNAALVLSVILFTTSAQAHLTAYSKGMYCKNGFKDGKKLTGNDALNSNTPVNPLYQLAFTDWWFHGQCRDDPPPDGEFLELPAGKSFQVEIASNRGKTSLSFGGQFTSEWPDGGNYPEDYHVDTCITSPNMHTQNQANAAGTAFAISYQSDLSKVTPENLAVFSIRYHTPWKRITHYDVPKALPKCPEGGCICAWGWVPNGCGQPNMYHNAFRCKVTGATSTAPVGKPKPPVWCEDDASKCVKGPKQMIYWHQASGNNIEVKGNDKSGNAKSPAYNSKLGFLDGPQDDIFDNSSSTSTGSSSANSDTGSSSPDASTSRPQSSSNNTAATTTTHNGSSKCTKRTARSLRRSVSSHRRKNLLSRF
ncbi:hypothetical protein DL96DRAFT_1593181 [Flagelloscypha sp. PMI_526]|nr:hypothetical protein DL96DRAFT_1593181 [Flagelloscypha sp. PMI_526]